MIEDNKHIAGSGGGGGKGGGQDPPTITPDNLHSKQFATLLDLISEGEIVRFFKSFKRRKNQRYY